MTKDRDGTQKDANRLRDLFSKFKFAVKEYQNLKRKDIDKLMENVHDSNEHKQMCCFVMFILAHGGTYKDEDATGEEFKGGAYFITSKGEKVPVLDIKKSLENTPGLMGIPKLLILQSCRGSTMDQGLSPDGRIPNGSDFLLSFATLHGYAAFRHQNNGSYFIQYLCDTFNEKNIAHYDVVSLMTQVTGKVADEDLKEGCITRKQNPETTFTFRRLLYFGKVPIIHVPAK